MTEQRGFFGILPLGPIRRALFGNGEFEDRKFLGIIMANSEEARIFRQAILSAVGASIVLGAYLDLILQRFPRRVE